MELETEAQPTTDACMIPQNERKPCGIVQRPTQEMCEKSEECCFAKVTEITLPSPIAMLRRNRKHVMPSKIMNAKPVGILQDHLLLTSAVF